MASWRYLVSCMLCGCAAVARAQGLPAEVEAALARAKLPADALTVVVADVEGKAPPRVAHRANAPVNPASIAKLATTFAAMELLGPAFSWSTPVYVDGPVQAGVLQGNLYIKGQGDPKLVAERIWLLMRRVQGLGIRRIAGDIVLDRSSFEVPPQDPGAFDGEPLRPYNAAPDALLVNYKSVLMTFTPRGTDTQVHVEPPLAGVQFAQAVPLAKGACNDWRGALQADFANPARIRFAGSYPAACGEREWPVAYAAPAAFSARAIVGMWQHLGGELGGQAREGRVPAGLGAVFELRSPPLAEVVRDINKYSNNVMAQQLFLTLGLQQKNPSTFEVSREVLRLWWRERIGGDDTPVFGNGSGLSREERITAQQLARLLQVAWASPLMPELMSSLPVTGVDGTLRRGRGKGSAGLAHLKTGSLRDVSGVAGYVLVAIANHPNAHAARPAIEALIDWAARDL